MQENGIRSEANIITLYEFLGDRRYHTGNERRRNVRKNLFITHVYGAENFVDVKKKNNREES